MTLQVVRIERDITFQKMMKKSSKKDITDFLQTPNKFSSKKKRQINKNKQKRSIEETSSKNATINNLDSSNKKELQVPILAIKESDLKAKNIAIAMIDAEAYCTACCLKEAQGFDVSMAEKKTRVETNPTIIVLQKYHDFLNLFLKKDSDTLSLYWKYNHKIYLEEEQKPSHALLYKISLKELDIVKR